MDFLKNLTNQPKADSEQQHTKPHGNDAEKMIDKITEAFEGLSHDQPPRKTPVTHTAGGGGLMDKISGTLEGHQKPAEKTHKDEGGLVDKISGAIGGHQKPVETHKEEEGLMDKISGAIGGHQKPVETHKKEEGLMDKISGVVGGHQKPAQEGGIMGHINNALGGGQAGEKKEGKHRALITRLPQLMFPAIQMCLTKVAVPPRYGYILLANLNL
jgi:hypothetical protein